MKPEELLKQVKEFINNQEFSAAKNFIEEHKKEYVHFILTGEL